MEYQKITNLLGTTLDEVPRLITKKQVKVHDQSGSADDRCKPSKQIRFKTSMLKSNLCDFSDAYIVVKGRITVTDPNDAFMTRNQPLKIMLHLLLVFQKLIIHSLITQKIQTS